LLSDDSAGTTTASIPGLAFEPMAGKVLKLEGDRPLAAIPIDSKARRVYIRFVRLGSAAVTVECSDGALITSMVGHESVGQIDLNEIRSVRRLLIRAEQPVSISAISVIGELRPGTFPTLSRRIQAIAEIGRAHV